MSRMDDRTEEQNCGTCLYHKKDNDEGDWVCDNHDGEYFQDFTGYDDSCPDWEGKERNALIADT